MIPSVENLMREKASLDNHHSAMMPLWDDCERLCSPMMTLNATTAPKTVRQITSTASLALQDLAAGMVYWVTPEATAWWRWKGQGKLKDDKKVRKFFQEAQEVGRDMLASSNFYSEIAMLFLLRGKEGTGALYAREAGPDQPDVPTLSFETWNPRDFWAIEDTYGRLHAVYRKLKLTASQCVEMFGEMAPDKAKKNVADTKPHEDVEVWHVLRRRTAKERNEGKNAKEKMEWASIYFSEDERKIIREDGQPEQRVFLSRWRRWDRRSPYGVSPSMFALADIRGENHMEWLIATLGHQKVEPPLFVPAEHQGTIGWGPRAITTYMDGYKPTEWQSIGDLNEGKDQIERRVKRIERAFMADIFAQFSRMDPATPVYVARQIRSEAMSRLAPSATLLNTDLMNPMLEALFMTCLRYGLLPEIPEELLDIERGAIRLPSVASTSKLTQELAAGTQAAVSDTLETMSLVTQFDPTALDALKLNEIGRSIAEERGIPSHLIRSPEEEEEYKQARADAQAQQQQAALATEVVSKNPEILSA